MRLNRYIRKYTTKRFKGKRRIVNLIDGPFANNRMNFSHVGVRTLIFTLRGQTGYYEGTQFSADMHWKEV